MTECWHKYSAFKLYTHSVVNTFLTTIAGYKKERAQNYAMIFDLC